MSDGNGLHPRSTDSATSWPALVLTAGLATRLQPLSSVRAKAALPVAGTPLVIRILRWLRESGVDRAVLNLHHLAPSITRIVGDGSALGLAVRYSWEREVLGSAGGPARAVPLLASDRFLIVNGDTLAKVDLPAMARQHIETNALVTMAVLAAARFRVSTPVPETAAVLPAPSAAVPLAAGLNQSLRESSLEHLERSKLVVLGLTTRDPHETKAEDWQYERRLAGSLLADTRLYRMAAQDRGVTDVARVMRDLETVLLEASLSDSSDRDALERVQRLIAKRDLVVKMQVVATGATAGL